MGIVFLETQSVRGSEPSKALVLHKTTNYEHENQNLIYVVVGLLTADKNILNSNVSYNIQKSSDYLN